VFGSDPHTLGEVGQGRRVERARHERTIHDPGDVQLRAKRDEALEVGKILGSEEEQLEHGDRLGREEPGLAVPHAMADPSALCLPGELDARSEDVDAKQPPAAHEHAVAFGLSTRLVRIDVNAQ
jgi:hypothetical protein